MKTRRVLALVLALCMVIGLAACGTPANNTPANNTTPADNSGNNVQPDPGKDDSKFYGPIYDEWSEMTDEQLYEKAKEELKDGSVINIYATSSKMLKNKDAFEEAFPDLRSRSWTSTTTKSFRSAYRKPEPTTFWAMCSR